MWLEVVGGLPPKWGWRTSAKAWKLLGSAERCSPVLPLNAEAWGLHWQSHPGMFDTGLEGSSSSRESGSLGDRSQVLLVMMLSSFVHLNQKLGIIMASLGRLE